MGISYDSILVIVDKLTKYVHLEPFKEVATAEELAYTFVKRIVAQHGTLDQIISDRDKLFTSQF